MVLDVGGDRILIDAGPRRDELVGRDDGDEPADSDNVEERKQVEDHLDGLAGWIEGMLDRTAERVRGRI